MRKKNHVCVLRYCDAKKCFSKSWRPDISISAIWQISNDNYGYDHRVVGLSIPFSIFGSETPIGTNSLAKMPDRSLNAVSTSRVILDIVTASQAILATTHVGHQNVIPSSPNIEGNEPIAIGRTVFTGSCAELRDREGSLCAHVKVSAACAPATSTTPALHVHIAHTYKPHDFPPTFAKV
jgi:hypothetical protein